MHSQKKITIGGILKSSNLIQICINSAPDKPGITGKILSFLGENGICVEYITEGCNIDGFVDISFCINPDYKNKLKQLFSQLKELINAKADRWKDDVCIISIYGPHFREKPNIAGIMCSALGNNNINIMGMSTSISTVSCVILNKDLNSAQETLESAFKLPKAL